jgi:hypothetical protein
MFGHEHPSAFGNHPWHDPFAPQDIFDPQPEQELAIAGPLAPRPENFPFTDQGRHDYYAAVRTAAHQQTVLQHQHMHMHEMHLMHEAQIRAHDMARANERKRQVDLLLLLS